jgi:hypothetical protein
MVERTACLASAALLALVVAGCAGPAGPAAPQEEGSDPGPWAGLYAGRLWGYGFIGVDPDGFGPWLPAVALDLDGNVLVFEVAYSQERAGGPPTIELDAGSVPWREAIAETLAPGAIYPSDGPTRFRVRDAESQQLSVEDRGRVRQAIEEGLADARAPQRNEGVIVADGGSRSVGAGGHRVTLDDNHDRGAGWGEVEEQLVRLADWMAGTGTA